MTDTTPEQVTLPDNVARVPEGWDGRLTVQELDIASRTVKTDVGLALREKGHPSRWYAMAVTAWVVAKRRDPHAKLQPYLELYPDQLAHVLRDDEDDETPTEPGDFEENPTESVPA